LIASFPLILAVAITCSTIENETISSLSGVVDPDNLEAQDHLTRILQKPAGVATHGSTLEDFQQIISKYLDEQVEQQKQLEFQNSVDVKSNLQVSTY